MLKYLCKLSQFVMRQYREKTRRKTGKSCGCYKRRALKLTGLRSIDSSSFRHYFIKTSRIYTLTLRYLYSNFIFAVPSDASSTAVD